MSKLHGLLLWFKLLSVLPLGPSIYDKISGAKYSGVVAEIAAIF